MFQEEPAIIQGNKIPDIKLHQYKQKYLYPKLNNNVHNGEMIFKD